MLHNLFLDVEDGAAVDFVDAFLMMLMFLSTAEILGVKKRRWNGYFKSPDYEIPNRKA